MEKVTRRSSLKVKALRLRILKIQGSVIEANRWGLVTLASHVARLWLCLEILTEIDPQFDQFIEKHSARVCDAPDCRRVFQAQAHSRNDPADPTYHRYHSKSCRSRHNMQKRRHGSRRKK